MLYKTNSNPHSQPKNPNSIQWKGANRDTRVNPSFCGFWVNVDIAGSFLPLSFFIFIRYFTPTHRILRIGFRSPVTYKDIKRRLAGIFVSFLQFTIMAIPNGLSRWLLRRFLLSSAGRSLTSIVDFSDGCFPIEFLKSNINWLAMRKKHTHKYRKQKTRENCTSSSSINWMGEVMAAVDDLDSSWVLERIGQGKGWKPLPKKTDGVFWLKKRSGNGGQSSSLSFL